MKKLYSSVFFIILNIFFYDSYAGELILDNGYIKAGCQVVDQGASQCWSVRKITCGGQVVLVKPRMRCQNGEPAPQTQNDTVKYDFNFNSLGGDAILGTISIKSNANVFASRPLNKNYRSYSSDGILDKPVILVEGYDPGDKIEPDYYYSYGFNQLVSEGRDLIIVSLPKGDGDITENANFLEGIIQEINSAKTGAFPTAVIGYSMGGIIARKALKHMEASGLNHQTSIYISFDAPHLGANSPLALQETVDDLINEEDGKLAGKTEDSLKRARNIYNSPAAREMLIAGPSYSSSRPEDFPENLVRVAVTSGNLLGVNGLQSNSVNEGDYVADFKFYLYKNWLGEWSQTYHWYSKKRGGIYYDNVPGSYEQQFRDAYLELKAGADYFSANIEAQERNITFVPTASSLAIPVNATVYLKSLFRTESPFDRYIAADETSGLSACASFELQNTDGKNIVHHPLNEYFNYSQLMQIKCALNQYQKNGVGAPDRSFKSYKVTSNPLQTLSVATLIPIWSLLLN